MKKKKAKSLSKKALKRTKGGLSLTTEAPRKFAKNAASPKL